MVSFNQKNQIDPTNQTNQRNSTNTMNAINASNPIAQLPNDLMTTFLELCDPQRDSLAALASESSWHSISHLSNLHGVTPFLYWRTRSLGIKLPEQIEKEWLGIYLYQIAQEQQARRQIKELKEILDPEGIPFILLKGASAMLRLYPQPGLRTFCDLDILIPADVTPRFKQAMMTAGYKPLSARNSPEDEELQKFDSHLDPICKDGSLMIESHLSILGAKGDHLAALSEIWQKKEAKSTDGINVEHLNIEHFIIHTLLHSSKHLTDEGFTEIKWLVDLLYSIKAWKIDWSKVRDDARKWGVEKEILPVMATLNQYWQADIPLPGTSEPIALNILLLGIQDRQKQYYANIPTSYLDRLFKIRELPDTKSRLSYLFHLFFPTRENLCWRYNLSSRWSIVPYYFLHPFFTLRKFLTGLWYELVYHPH
jgi:hypothetical protein